MLRIVGRKFGDSMKSGIISRASIVGTQPNRLSHQPALSEEEFDRKYEEFFNRPDIDHWEIRKAMNALTREDLIPEPKIIIAALKAARRLNDYAITVRYLESVKDKCGSKVGEIWPYIVQEIRPTLDELGCNTPEELGWDKPELALVSPYNVH